MNVVGIVRRVDDLGRIVIPREIRQQLRIKEGAPLEILPDGNGNIILKKIDVERNILDDIRCLEDTLGYFPEQFDDESLRRIKTSIEDIKSYVRK